jgi:hypothetical protein
MGGGIPLLPELKEAIDKWRAFTIKNWPSTPWICHYKGRQIKRLYAIVSYADLVVATEKLIRYMKAEKQQTEQEVYKTFYSLGFKRKVRIASHRK